MSRDDRKQLLALACAADRVAWAKAFQPAPSQRPGLKLAGELLVHLENLSAFLPGKLGRWARKINYFAQLGRQFGWLRL